MDRTVVDVLVVTPAEMIAVLVCGNSVASDAVSYLLAIAVAMLLNSGSSCAPKIVLAGLDAGSASFGPNCVV